MPPIPLTGTVRTPEGGRFNGTLRLTLSYSACHDIVDDDLVVARQIAYPIINGALPASAEIVPNTDLQPTNTWYVAEYFSASGAAVAKNHYYIDGDAFDIGSAVPSPITTANLAFSEIRGEADAIGYLQSGAGAIERTVQTRLREKVSLKDFGATGDGSDQTQAFLDAIARVAPGGQIDIDEGDYRFTVPLDFTGKPGVALIGKSWQTTVVRTAATTHDGIVPWDYCRFAHFTLRGAGSTTGGPNNYFSTGFDSGGTAVAPRVGIVIENLVIEDWPSFAINTGGYADGWWIRNNVIRRVHSTLIAQGGQGCHILHNDFSDAKYNGLDLGGTKGSFVIGNRIHNCGLQGAFGATGDVSGLFLCGIGDVEHPTDNPATIAEPGDANIVEGNHIFDNPYSCGIDIRCMADLTCDRSLVLGNHIYRNKYGISVGGNAAGTNNYSLLQGNFIYDNSQYGIIVDGQSTTQQVFYTRIAQNITRNNGVAGVIVGGANAKNTQIIDNLCIDEVTPIIDGVSGYTQIYGNKTMASVGPTYEGSHFKGNSDIIAVSNLRALGGYVSVGDAYAQTLGAIRLEADLGGAIMWRNAANTDDEGVIYMTGSDDMVIRGGNGDDTAQDTCGLVQTGPGTLLPVLSWHNSGRIHLWGATSYQSTSFAIGATLPSVTGGSHFFTQNTSATAITDFTGGTLGQILYVVAGDGLTTIVHSSQIRLKGGGNILMPVLSALMFMNVPGAGWVEL